MKRLWEESRQADKGAGRWLCVCVCVCVYDAHVCVSERDRERAQHRVPL